MGDGLQCVWSVTSVSLPRYVITRVIHHRTCVCGRKILSGLQIKRHLSVFSSALNVRVYICVCTLFGICVSWCVCVCGNSPFLRSLRGGSFWVGCRVSSSSSWVTASLWGLGTSSPSIPQSPWAPSHPWGSIAPLSPWQTARSRSHRGCHGDLYMWREREGRQWVQSL